MCVSDERARAREREGKSVGSARQVSCACVCVCERERDLDFIEELAGAVIGALSDGSGHLERERRHLPWWLQCQREEDKSGEGGLRWSREKVERQKKRVGVEGVGVHGEGIRKREREEKRGGVRW